MNKIIKYFAIILVTLLVVTYLYFENNTLEISKYKIKSKKTIELVDFKIAQISDYHNSNSKSLKKSIIKSLNKEKPNIIVITGDLVDSRFTNIDVSIDLITEIKDIAPIYYVSGNHESRIGSDYDILKRKLLDNNVIIMEDKIEQINFNGAILNLVGISDPALEHKSYLDDKEIVAGVLKELKYDRNSFTILLSHRPELYELYTEYEYDLVLSGHAHGGQIRIPFIGGIVAPNQWFLPKYDGGLYEEGTTKMIVSRGIGNSILPFRINNNPELVYITITK